MNADSIKIECEDDGFHLTVETERSLDANHPLVHSFRITDPEALYDAVKREIGPWLYERDMAPRKNRDVNRTLEIYANLDNWEHVGAADSLTWRWTGSLGPPWVLAQDALQCSCPAGMRYHALNCPRWPGLEQHDPDESGGYDRSDPKHPDWHSVHADIYDQRAGK